MEGAAAELKKGFFLSAPAVKFNYNPPVQWPEGKEKNSSFSLMKNSTNGFLKESNAAAESENQYQRGHLH